MTTSIHHFIARWQASGAAERANYQLFLSELCDALDVPRPDPTTPDEQANAYVFEKPVPLPPGAPGRIDLYRRSCFVLEATQGADPNASGPAPVSAEGQARLRSRKKGAATRGTPAWDTAMEKARQQAQRYARNLPGAELAEGGRPPFLIVVDVGESLALYSEFTRTGGNYDPFPDPLAATIPLTRLADPAVRDLLRAVWLDPMSLDPARHAAAATREIADRLARLARALEKDHPADQVAAFLMRCLFTMFAEDVNLLPEGSFTDLLAASRRSVAHFPQLVEELWARMASGGYSVALRQDIPHFNGGLFEEARALPLNADQLQLLIEAARADWRDVEPAIFGTLLEHALETVERRQLGAHFTPRAYVERLVGPAVVEPLRAEWEAAQAAAVRLLDDGKPDKALAEVEAFQKRLASVRILDPACGTGNFLYVSLEHLLRLEADVLRVRSELGKEQMLLELEDVRVTPRQLLGIEVNPRAAAIAELVLWIGFLRWRLRIAGDVGHIPQPLLDNYHTIERRDAVLAWDAVEPLLDKAGQPVTRWDGRTTRRHPVTGEQAPDEAARIPAWRYVNPRPAEWPAADFVVGNPPFIGNKRMRHFLGDGYVDAIREAYPELPATCDFVMYWWHAASRAVRAGTVKRFGLITTNSVTQPFNRAVIRIALAEPKVPISLVFAVQDHPWVDLADGAKVRISMTVASIGDEVGKLLIPVSETDGDEETPEIVFTALYGRIAEDLTVGVHVTNTAPLRANRGLCLQGVKLVGKGFLVSQQEVMSFPQSAHAVIRQYMTGRDFMQSARGMLVIDLEGLSEHDTRQLHPEVYQRLYDTVRPLRLQNKDRQRRERWWLFGRANTLMRAAICSLDRFIVTAEVSKHRVFAFVERGLIPDASLYAIGTDDPYLLGVLSSKAHVRWTLATGGTLEDRPRYNNTLCFEKFPFPAATSAQQARIRALAEELDAHRKRQQALHPRLTLTDMYNVLEKLRAGEPLTKAEQATHEQGLVSVLRQLHDEIDAAVFDAYGWPATLTDEEILVRLVSLNAERAAEEARGVIRWLRPEYQARAAQAAPVAAEEVVEAAGEVVLAARAWPGTLAEQAAAVRAALAALGRPATGAEIAAAFDAAPVGPVTEWLAALVALGQARDAGDGRFVAG